MKKFKPSMVSIKPRHKQKTRTCKKCGETKILSALNFSPDNSEHGIKYREGYQGQCRDCRRAIGKLYQRNQIAPNPDRTPQAPASIGQTQTCVKCGITKPLNAENFVKESKVKSGYRADCKTCRRAAQKGTK